MSAFLVCDEHIRALVEVARTGPADVGVAEWNRYGTLEWYTREGGTPHGHRLDPDMAAAMLAQENLRSIRRRYGDDEPSRHDCPQVVPHRAPRDMPTLVEALKAIACYEYQACETTDWEDSEAYAFCRALQDRLCARLPGYEKAPWEWQPTAIDDPTPPDASPHPALRT